MTVQQLIEKLSEISDKSLDVLNAIHLNDVTVVEERADDDGAYVVIY